MSVLTYGILGILLLLVLLAPRKWAALALLGGVLFLTQGEALKLAGLNFYPIRLLAMAAFARAVLRRELAAIQLNPIDKALLIAYFYATGMVLLRTATGFGTSAAVAQLSVADKIGYLLDLMCCYIASRAFIRDASDLEWLLRRLALLLIPYVLLVWQERLSGHNPFAAVGGIPLIWADVGRLRCRGSFMHPSLLGTFGASFFLMYISLALTSGNRLIGLLGMAANVCIVLLANSGGPLNFLGAGAVGWLLWGIRTRMYLFRRALVAALALLAIAMKRPLWYLPAKISDVSGGDGWHRAYLMDQAFRHLDRWWLAGMPLDVARDWFPYLVKGAVDITNLYLLFGFDGGVVALALFVLLIVRAFRGLGSGLARVRRGTGDSRAGELMLWGLGTMLAGHCANFLAITYFDQTRAVWAMQLAFVSTLSYAHITFADKSAAIASTARTAGVPVPPWNGARQVKMRRR